MRAFHRWGESLRGAGCLATLVAVLLISTSCRSTTVGNLGSPADDLRAAVSATASLPSFRVAATPIQDGKEVGGTTIDFNSPDRFALLLDEPDQGPTIIVIGPSAYFAVDGRDGFFEERPTPQGALEAYPLFALDIIESAQEVTREGNQYEFVAGLPDEQSSIEGTAWLSDGLVVKAELSLPGAGGEPQPVRFEFSHFGAVDEVTPPREDHVLPPGTGLPSCGPQGSPPPGTPVCFPL